MQAVVEATAQGSMLFELFNLMRSEIRFDLSLLYLRPLFFQIKYRDTSGLTWDEYAKSEENLCIGWYSELKLMPLYFQVF